MRSTSPGGAHAPGHGDAPADRTGRREPATATATVVAVGLVAWALAVDPWGLRPFTTLRWPLLGATVLIAAAIGWRVRPPVPRAIRGLGLALLAWLALAAAVGVDPLHAWLGHPQRHLGVVAWVVLVLAFRVGTVMCRPPALRVLGRGVMVSLVVVGAGAALELAGWSVAGAATAPFGTRVSGLLGQPAYLGAASVLLVPVALGAAARERGAWQAVGIVAAALGTLAVVASQTRGAWLGLLAAAAIAWPAVRSRLGRRRAAAAAGAAAAAVLVVALLTPLGGRAFGAFDLDGGSGSGRGRLDEWRVAAAVVADHPLVGVGPEGYRIAATEHLDGEYARRYGRTVVVDRAHDGVLDVAAAGGVPAAVLYVALTGVVLVSAVRARREANLVVVGAAAALVGYAVQQLVLFPVAEVDPIAWLLAGVVVGAGAARPGPRAASTGTGSGRWSTRFLRAGALAAAIALLVLGALDVAADRHLATAAREQASGDHLAALAAADAATALRPDSIDTWLAAAGIAAAGESLVDVDAALDRVDAGLARSPLDPALADRRSGLLVERGLRSQLTSDLDAAQQAVDARLAVDGANPAHHRRLGLMLLARGDVAPAVNSLERTLELDPDDPVASAALDRARGASR